MKKAPGRFVCGLIIASLMLSFVTKTEAQTVEQPSVMRAVVPVFPHHATEMGPWAMGSVILEAQVNHKGDVIDVHAVSGHPLLYKVSENAIRRWLFAPCSDKSKARSVRLKFIFKLMDEGTAEEDLSPIFTPPYQIEVRRILPLIIQRETEPN